MDIKGALNAIMPTIPRVKDVTDKTIRSGSTTDRDGNGQQQYQGQGQKHGPMSEEQFKKAVDYIKGLEAVKEHNLSLEVAEVNGVKIVILKEPDGKVIRRIYEEELWTLQILKDESPKKGQLLRKTA